MKKTKVRRTTIIGNEIKTSTRMVTIHHKSEPEEDKIKPPKKDK